MSAFFRAAPACRSRSEPANALTFPVRFGRFGSFVVNLTVPRHALGDYRASIEPLRAVVSLVGPVPDRNDSVVSRHAVHARAILSVSLAETGAFAYASAVAAEGLRSSHDLFFKPSQVHGVSIQAAPRATDFRRTLHNRWGLSLFLESQRGSE